MLNFIVSIICNGFIEDKVISRVGVVRGFVINDRRKEKERGGKERGKRIEGRDGG